MADTAQVEASVDNAAGLIAQMREAPEPVPSTAPTDDAPATPAEPQAEAEAEAQAGDDQVADAEPEAPEQDAEAADDITDDPSAPEQDEGEDADETPTVDAPTAFSDAEKAEFASLPVEAQQIVAGREAERDTAFQTKTTELGERSKLLDAAVQAAQNSSLEQLQMSSALMAEAMQASGFVEEPNWQELRATMDRDDVQDIRDAWDDTQRRLGSFQQNFQQAKQNMQTQADGNKREYIAGENKETASRWPDYANLKTREAAVNGLYDYLETEGVTREQSANLADANFITIARKAMAYDALQKSKPGVKKKVSKAPKMGKPGAPKSKATGRAEGIRAALQQAGNSTNPNDIAGLFAALRQQE
jgi:hypothetical protein